MTMLEPADPWQRPRRPGAGGKATGLATMAADRVAGHIPLPAVPVAAGWARRRGIETLQDRGLSPDTVEVVSLLISELVTNALQHGMSAAAVSGSAARCADCGGQLCLNLREEPGAIVIEVFDAALMPPRRSEGACPENVSTEDVFTDASSGRPESDRAGVGELDFDDLECEGAERGRGLLLVASLSEEQGYYLPQAGGKVVWCVVKAEV
jgi:anti-sigma regulatory factor (Ser/Thr protein kinase)